MHSRLFTVDAGLDANKLRTKYSSFTRYLIVKGIVSVKNEQNKTDQTSLPIGLITRLTKESIHLPSEFMPLLQTFTEKKDKQPYYKIKLAYGQRYEPWIQSLEVATTVHE